jgi:Fe-S-cluster containining protein
MPPPLPPGDQTLIQIMDAALADTTRRSGDWLVCKLGCTQCCIGVFAINQLDVLRLQHGLAELETNDPARAARVKDRARDSVARLKDEFPGDPQTGILDESDAGAELFESFANDEPCPVLDPVTGACDLYASRPMTCRVFGPPVRSEDGLGVCELCYDGAAAEQIAACEMRPDPDGLEGKLVKELENSGSYGQTIIAFALAS